MLISLKLIIYVFRRSAKKALSLMLTLFVAELLFFGVIKAAGELGIAGKLDGDLAYDFFAALPSLFYLIALVVPLIFFLRLTSGKEACLMRSLPAAPDVPVSAMVMTSAVLCGAAEIGRLAMSAYALSMTGAFAELERGDFFILVLSPYGPTGYTLKVTRNILGVVCIQLFFAMAVLLAAMSLRRKKQLTVVYLLAGSALMVPAYALLTSGVTIEDQTAAGTAFFFYLPQLIFFMSFIIIFTVVSAFLLKRKHDV